MPQPAPSQFFTVDYGNHRAAAVLVLLNQGALAPETVVGSSYDYTTKHKEIITAGGLNELYQQGALSTSNSYSNGQAWLNFSRVDDIRSAFDIGKFFEEDGRNGQHGIVLRAITPQQAQETPAYAEVRDNAEGERFADYLVRHLTASQQADVNQSLTGIEYHGKCSQKGTHER